MDAQFASFARQQRGSLLPIRRKAEEDWKSLAECDRKLSLIVQGAHGQESCLVNLRCREVSTSFNSNIAAFWNWKQTILPPAGSHEVWKFKGTLQDLLDRQYGGPYAIIWVRWPLVLSSLPWWHSSDIACCLEVFEEQPISCNPSAEPRRLTSSSQFIQILSVWNSQLVNFISNLSETFINNRWTGHEWTTWWRSSHES